MADDAKSQLAQQHSQLRLHNALTAEQLKAEALESLHLLLAQCEDIDDVRKVVDTLEKVGRIEETQKNSLATVNIIFGEGGAIQAAPVIVEQVEAAPVAEVLPAPDSIEAEIIDLGQLLGVSP